MFTRCFLITVRRKAYRRGVWFKALDRVERSIVNLTAHLVEEVKSVVLGVELVWIMKKLRDAVKSGFVKRMESYGFKRAREVAMQAIEWGYITARDWASDLGFVIYLTLIDLNKAGYF